MTGQEIPESLTDILYNELRNAPYDFCKRIHRIELRLEEALEGKGGEKTFDEWWNKNGNDLFHKGASRYDIAKAAWNASK